MRVALVTVGDEILAGETTNSNAAWLGRKLTERGVDVERITVLPDRVSEIARVVNEYQAAYDGVIVTGGLGPTHDDVTMEAVAAAFGTELEHSEATYRWLQEEKAYPVEELADGTTHIPRSGELLRNPEGVAPGCTIGNVYVMPGLPTEMRAMFELVESEFSGRERHVEAVVTSEPESHLLDRIAEMREEFGVTVGSYPGENVRVRIEGTDRETVTAAVQWLEARVDPPE